MKIKSITIDGMHNVSHKSYSFDDVNYIVGSNGAGKSTILQSIQLALLGYIPGYKRTNVAIFEHANGPTMSVTLELDKDGSTFTVRRTWLKTKSSVTSTTVVDPEDFKPEDAIGNLEFPIFNFSEFVNMTANSLKDWFIKFLPNSKSNVDWNAVMNEAKTKFPSSNLSVDMFSGFATDIAGVAQANTFLKGAMSSEKQQLDRDIATIQSLIYYDDVDSQIAKPELVQRRTVIMEKIRDISKSESIKASNARFQSMIDDYSNRLASIDPSEFDNYDNLISEFQHKINALVADISKLNNADSDFRVTKNDKSKIINSNGVCPYTASKCASIEKLIDEYTKDIADLESKHAEITKMVKDKSDELNRYIADMDEFKRRKSNFDELNNKIAELKNAILPEFNTCENIDELNKQLDEVNDSISKLTANEQYTNLIDMLTKSKFEHENNIELMKYLIKVTSVNGIQSEMIDGPFTEFKSKLDKYITLMFDKGTHPEFNLSQAANSFSFGLIRSNKYIPFSVLSSGEKCLYMIAIMTCICESSSGIRTILVDDMLDHLDDSNIDVLFKVINKIPEMQFIFAGVAKYDGSVNKIEVV